MLVLLAPEKVAALSPLARDPALSFVARGRRRPAVRAPSAEAVLRLHPDLVLAAPFGAQTTLALLEAKVIPVLRMGLPQSFEAIRAETRLLADALGVPERGEALIARDGRAAPGAAPSGASRAGAGLAGARLHRGAGHARWTRCCGRPAS